VPETEDVWAIERIIDVHASFCDVSPDGGGLILVVDHADTRGECARILPAGTLFSSRGEAVTSLIQNDQHSFRGLVRLETAMT
jgi:hypothetical protein